jgi:hypothetical protein
VVKRGLNTNYYTMHTVPALVSEQLTIALRAHGMTSEALYTYMQIRVDAV